MKNIAGIVNLGGADGLYLWRSVIEAGVTTVAG